MSELEEIINKVFTDLTEKKRHLIMMTGRGGCKDLVKAFLTEFNLKHNYKNFANMYRYLVHIGTIKKVGTGGYQIES